MYPLSAPVKDGSKDHLANGMYRNHSNTSHYTEVQILMELHFYKVDAIGKSTGIFVRLCR